MRRNDVRATSISPRSIGRVALPTRFSALVNELFVSVFVSAASADVWIFSCCGTCIPSTGEATLTAAAIRNAAAASEERSFDYRRKQDYRNHLSGGDQMPLHSRCFNILTRYSGRSFVLRNAFEFVILGEAGRSPERAYLRSEEFGGKIGVRSCQQI
ncbi:hypothetical protein KCP78_05290 [Salmonella enterica subsp. enterica]|nr:hypothetical protein KCP78_05290 [Salmonella enterica subsp. enterica]